jgi:hypothetical protein
MHHKLLLAFLFITCAAHTPAAHTPATPVLAARVHATHTRTALATGKLVNDVVAMYPRAIVLSHQPSVSNNGLILVDFTSFAPGGIGTPLSPLSLSLSLSPQINTHTGAIYSSSNNGTSFTQVGAVNDPGAANGLCCTVIFELPSQVGNMPAGISPPSLIYPSPRSTPLSRFNYLFIPTQGLFFGPEALDKIQQTNE